MVSDLHSSSRGSGRDRNRMAGMNWMSYKKSITIMLCAKDGGEGHDVHSGRSGC